MSNIKSGFGHNTRRKGDRDREIDLALAIMCTLQRPGECIPHRIIAEIIGMAHSGPWSIEQTALRKVRNQLRYLGHRALRREIA